MRGTPVLYFKSLNRPFHVLGVDRQLFYLIIGLCLPIAFSGRLSLLMDSLALVSFGLLYVAGFWITRADHQMLALYRRHIHYRKYYAAQSGIHAKVKLVKSSVPIYNNRQGAL